MTPDTPLHSELDHATQHERQRALRMLLQRPLLTSTGSDAPHFILVRKHVAWLREWLYQNCGWALHVDPEVARLTKTPATLGDETRPAREPRQGLPFSRRRYALLCLALAALERSDRQTALGKLADDIMNLTATDPALAQAGMAFDLQSQDQRRDLVQVIRFLIAHQVLVHVHGDEQQYLSGRGDMLCRINRSALARILNVRRGPSTVEATTLSGRIDAITDEPIPDSDEGRNRYLRWRLTRKLIDDPVLYYADATEAELAYLRTQRGRILNQIEQATGLIAETRREGIALTDDRGDATDLGMPEEGTEGHLTLLLAEYLAHRLRQEPEGVVGMETLRQHTAGLIAEHKSHWRKNVREPGAEIALTDQALERLESLGLTRRVHEGTRPLPAIGRYALVEDTPRLPGLLG